MADKRKNSIARADIGLRLIVQVFCVVFLVIIANVIGFQYFARGDFSRSQKFALAEQTKQVLRQLQKDVTMIAYFSGQAGGLESALYPDLQNLLREYEFSGRDRVEVELVSPARELSRARELLTKYGITGDQNVLILDYDGQVAVVPVIEMGDYDLSGVATGEPARLVAFAGEQAITGALLGLLNPTREVVYSLEGHGEVPVGEMTILADALDRQNAALKKLNLAGGGGVPPDASVVLIAEPTYDLTAAEMTALRAYWKADGRLIVAFDPGSETPRLTELIADVGIVPETNRVLAVYPSPLQPGTYGVSRDVPGLFLEGSQITKRLDGVTGLFPTATQTLRPDGKVAAKAGVRLRPLVGAPEEFWGETDFETLQDGVNYDDGTDAGQPFEIAISAERGGTEDDRVEVESAKLVAVGNRDFLRDETMRTAGANLDFVISSINWMVDRSKLTGVTPKVVQRFTLSLTPAEIDRIGFYVMLLIPGVVAVFGLFVAWRRRA